MSDAEKRARLQRQRQRWLAWIASSYALDATLLALFFAAGTVPVTLPLGYAAAGALIVAANWAIYASGWNLRWRDPNLTVPFLAIAGALQFAVVLLAPQLAFPWLANLVTVFAFGMIWLPVRPALMVWGVGMLATAGVLALVGGRAGVPVATFGERALVWVCFSLILGRFVLLSAYASDLRARLTQSRRALAESLEQIQELAHYDELTGLLNRRSLIARLEQERERASRTRQSFSVALFDLDHFKEVNDSHGHGVGDEVLRQFAAAVRGTMRKADAFGRYGGEEFLLILSATPAEAALPVLERVRAGVAAHRWEALAPRLTVNQSVGVAGYRAGESVEQLLQRADRALYDAKRAGRNRVVMEEAA